MTASPDISTATAPDGPSTTGRAISRADTVLTAVCILCIATSSLIILSFGYGRDQGIYSMVARTVLEGGMPYRDAWDFKTPGIFLVYALSRALFGSTVAGIRVLEVAGLGAMAFALVRFAREHWGNARIGLAAAAIAAFVHAELEFWHTAQPETFGGMLTVFALLLVPGVKPTEGPSSFGRHFAAGSLYGFAGLLKPPLAGGALVVLLASVWMDVRRQRSSHSMAAAIRRAVVAAVRPGVALFLGGALPFALCVAWFAAKGALGDLYQVLFVFTPHYTALGWTDSTVLGMLYYGFTTWLTNYCSLPTVGLLLLLAIRPSDEEKPAAFLLLGLIAVHLVGITMQGKFFPYHYGATWPLTALLAALGYFKIWEKAARKGPLLAGAFLVAMVLIGLMKSATKDLPDSFRTRCMRRLSLALGGWRDQKAIDELTIVADVNGFSNRKVADALRERVPEKRAVYVWGFAPSIYDMSGLASATRYIYNIPQRVAWDNQDARASLMNDLSKTPPAAIVVEQWDVIPMVTGAVIDSKDTLRDFPALARLIEERYELWKTIDNFQIYVER